MRSHAPLVAPLVLCLVLRAAVAQCAARLPTADNIGSSARIVNGLLAAPSDIDNVVTIAETRGEDARAYSCVGSLIAPEWVVTAAQCFIRPNTNFVLHGGTSLTGNRYEIVYTTEHPGYLQAGQAVHRDDIRLVRLDRPVGDSVLPSPSPSPRTTPTPGETADAPSELPPPAEGARRDDLPAVNENFRFMYINNNTDFAMDEPRYLRLKGFGITTQPQEATEPLTLQTRGLRFADLRTASCDDTFGNDGKRRLCTRRNDECGACFGDVGAPLYDVDSSGTFSVLVGIVTFGQEALSLDTPVCTGERPVAYTAVARYADWIRDTVRRESGEERVFFFQLPKAGITNTNLARDTSPLAIFATTSVIVIACLALLGTTAAVIVTCVLRRLRKKRKRWLEGLQAEDSFVKAGEKEAVIVDPFEGIQDDQQPRFSFTGFSRAAVKGATEFSSRSIGVLKALVQKEKDPEFMEAREAIDGAPVWVSTAWDKLFMPPSKKDLRKIHTIPTQRVVDDVLSGADKSVELSLEEVAYKSKRDEANLEAAWAKLEIQTSLRNLSEVGGSTADLFSPSKMSPSMSPLAASPRKGSRNSSRIVSRFGSDKRELGDLTKADTLLAAFATIDAESEQVAEETAIDSSALRALAEMKRPNVLAALRRKFSGGPSSPGVRANDRGQGGRGDTNSALDSKGPEQLTPGGSRLGSGWNSRTLTALSSTSGVLTKGSVGSRQSSMLMDYFSENYSISSDSDDEHISFEDVFEGDHRRYTEDRKPQTEHENRSILSFRSMRRSQNRSFESLDRNASSDSLSFQYDMDDMGRSSGSQRDRSEGTSRSQKHSSLPVPTPLISSEKRPRSSTIHTERGAETVPRGKTQEYSEVDLGDDGTISVRMEEPSPPVPSALPDRSDHRRSQQASTAATNGSKARQERQAPIADHVSVQMEDKLSHTNRDACDVKVDQRQHFTSSIASSSKDRPRGFFRETPGESNDESMVRIEDTLREMKPSTQSSSTSLPAQNRATEINVPKQTVPKVIPTQDITAEDMVTVHMEEDPSYDTRPKSRRKGDRAVAAVDSAVKNVRPTSETTPSKTPLFRDGDTITVHMEDETSAGPLVRKRISEFDESEKQARRVSEPSSSQVRRTSNVSVEKLKSIWNEIARRNSEDSYMSQ